VRRPASEKMEVVRLVDGADLPVRMILRQLGVPSSTFYGWYGRLRGRRLRWPSRSKARASAELECNSRTQARWDPGAGSRQAGALTSRDRMPLHRRRALLRVRIERIPHSEGCRPDHESNVCTDVSGRCVQEPDDASPRDVANGLHILPNHQLGLVFPID
jgi:transposase-like protein